MSHKHGPLELKFAKSDLDIKAAQRLRYRVFVEELGSDGEQVDHDNRLEIDEFDQDYMHLMLLDPKRSDDVLEQCVAVYRLLPGESRDDIGKFYSENEYDLSKILNSNKRILELGRSCIDSDYRGGTTLFQMWTGLANYVLSEGFSILFGTASFHGLELEDKAHALSYLQKNHLAPEELRASVLPENRINMDILPHSEIDKKIALASLPPLIKSYLRLGGVIGEGAYRDAEFNTIDVMLIVDIDNVSDRQKALFSKSA